MVFRWTEEAVERLRKLAAKGLTSAKIGEALGCAHDTVIRKCGCEGIALLSGRNRQHGVSPCSIYQNSSEILPLAERIGVGPAVAALNARHCHWPVGSPDAADFHFCSQPLGIKNLLPYCDKHQHLAVSHKG